jgi:hypothetical protein
MNRTKIFIIIGVIALAIILYFIIFKKQIISNSDTPLTGTMPLAPSPTVTATGNVLPSYTGPSEIIGGVTVRTNLGISPDSATVLPNPIIRATSGRPTIN